MKRRTRKNWFAAYKAACPGQVKKVGKNAFTLLLLRRASRKLFWTRKNKKRLIKKRRKVVLLRKKKGILLKGMRRFFKKNKKRIKNKRWVRYKDKESSYKMIKFYDADFTGRLFTHKTKAFREKGVFYVRQNRKLTWKLANTINPYKLRRRRRGFRTIAFLMKQRIKLFYRHLSERQLRRLFANARHRQRKILKRQTSYVMRLLERRLDNAVFRTGFFKMSEVKQYIKRNGVFINGHLCKRLNRKLSVGDIITFHKNFKVKQRFALFLRRQYPYTKYERGDRSVWNKKGLRFNFKLGIF